MQQRIRVGRADEAVCKRVWADQEEGEAEEQLQELQQSDGPERRLHTHDVLREEEVDEVDKLVAVAVSTREACPHRSVLEWVQGTGDGVRKRQRIQGTGDQNKVAAMDDGVPLKKRPSPKVGRAGPDRALRNRVRVTASAYSSSSWSRRVPAFLGWSSVSSLRMPVTCLPMERSARTGTGSGALRAWRRAPAQRSTHR